MTAVGQTPKHRARDYVDAMYPAAGGEVQDGFGVNLAAARDFAVREFPLERGRVLTYYPLFDDGNASGALETQAEGHKLARVAAQARNFPEAVPSSIEALVPPPPFLWVSTCAETRLTTFLPPRPRPRSHELFAVDFPETLVDWIIYGALVQWAERSSATTTAENATPSTIRARLLAMPERDLGRLHDD